MFGRKTKIVLGIVLLAIIGIAGYFFYLYYQGGEENYKPPMESAAPDVQVISDMTLLSGAVEAYFAKNLKYPEKPDELVPEFISTLPLEAATGKPFIYTSDGSLNYKITVADASRYGFKELFIENGQVIKK